MSKKTHIFDTHYSKPKWISYNQGICGTSTEDEHLLDHVNFNNLDEEKRCKKCTKMRLQIEEAIKTYQDTFAGYYYFNENNVGAVVCIYIYKLKYMGGDQFRITAIQWQPDRLIHRNHNDPVLLDKYVDLRWMKELSIFPSFTDMKKDDIIKLTKILAL